MAYLKDIPKRHCGYVGCRKPVVVELYNNRNAGLGYYCQPHGNTVVERLKRQEGQV